MADRRSAVLHGLASGREPLVGRAAGVGCHQFDVDRFHIKFFGRHLKKRSTDALPQLRLAGKDGDCPVRIDPDPGVEETVVVETARQFRRLGGTTRGASCATPRRDSEKETTSAPVPFSKLRRLMPLGSKAMVIPHSFPAQPKLAASTPQRA